MSITVSLASKTWLMEEPVFGDLKQILKHYNALATCATTAEQLQHLQGLLALFFGDKLPAINRISPDEWTAFLQAIPVACGLETTPVESKKSSKETDWGYLYGHLCASLAWDYDYVDRHMTMNRLKELQAYWLAHPPTHLLVAAFMGYEKQEQDSVQAFFNRMKARVIGAKK